MITGTEKIISTLLFKNIGECNRCHEHKNVNAYGLCEECDHIIDEEYEVLYQESLEADFI